MRFMVILTSLASLLAAAWAAGACSSSGGGATAGVAASTGSLQGTFAFSPQFVYSDPDYFADGGLEPNTVEAKIYDTGFTCTTVKPGTGAYRYVKVKVENSSGAPITAGTYTIDPSNPDDVYVRYYQVDSNGNEVVDQESVSGSITLSSVSGASAQGSFSAQLASDMDAGSGSLSGSFTANPCPQGG